MTHVVSCRRSHAGPGAAVWSNIWAAMCTGRTAVLWTDIPAEFSIGVHTVLMPGLLTKCTDDIVLELTVLMTELLT